MSFFLCKNFISSFIREILAFLVAVCALGEVLGNLMFAYLGVIPLMRHCLLKYIFAQQFWSFDLMFNTLKFVYKMSVDILKFVVAVQNWFVRRAGCSIVYFYNSSEM
jgi:hypothetical protein